MKKQEAADLLDIAYKYGKQLIQFWHEKKLEHIRLKTANLRRLEKAKNLRILENKKQFYEFKNKQYSRE